MLPKKYLFLSSLLWSHMRAHHEWSHCILVAPQVADYSLALSRPSISDCSLSTKIHFYKDGFCPNEFFNHDDVCSSVHSDHFLFRYCIWKQHSGENSRLRAVTVTYQWEGPHLGTFLGAVFKSAWEHYQIGDSKLLLNWTKLQPTVELMNTFVIGIHHVCHKGQMCYVCLSLSSTASQLPVVRHTFKCEDLCIYSLSSLPFLICSLSLESVRPW